MSDAEDGEPEKDASSQAWEREKHQAQLDAFQTLVGELTTQREENGRTERVKRLLEVITIVMVFLTLCATGFGDWVFFKTMKEARADATKAHDDNVAALTNARTAAYIQHWETEQALAHADTANSQAKAASDAALRRADTANEQVRAEQRPWVYANKIIPAGRIIRNGEYIRFL